MLSRATVKHQRIRIFRQALVALDQELAAFILEIMVVKEWAIKWKIWPKLLISKITCHKIWEMEQTKVVCTIRDFIWHNKNCRNSLSWIQIMKRLSNTRNRFTVMDYQDLMAVSRSLVRILETSQPLRANKNQMVQVCSVLPNLLIRLRILAAIPLDL